MAQFQLVERIYITNLGNIKRLNRAGSHSMTLETLKPMTEIEFKAGTANWQVQTKQTVAGAEYETTLNFTPKQRLRWTHKPLIVVLKLCNGEKRIIGSPYIPVFPEATESQENKNITIKHSSWSFPMLVNTPES